MTKISPVTKLAILVGVVAIPYLLWTSSSGTPTGVAGVPKERAAQASAPEPADDAVPKRRELPALQTFAAVVERPLFTPTRRLVRPVEAPATEPEPPPAATTEEAAPEAPPTTPRPDLRFFGTMRHGKTFAALVTRAGGTGSQTLAVGDTVDDWQVAEVDRDRLVLAHEGERYTLSIFAKGEGGAKPPPAQSPKAEPEDNGAADGDSIPPDESATGDAESDTDNGNGDEGGQ
jgi:hypothetical protein